MPEFYRAFRDLGGEYRAEADHGSDQSSDARPDRQREFTEGDRLLIFVFRCARIRAYRGRRWLMGASTMSEIEQVIRTTCPRDCYDTCGVAVHVLNGAIESVRGDPDHFVSHGPVTDFK